MAKTMGMGIKIGNMQKLGFNAGKVPKGTQGRQRTWQKTRVQRRSRRDQSRMREGGHGTLSLMCINEGEDPSISLTLTYT